MKYDIFGTFRSFSLRKKKKWIHFLVVLFHGVFWENMSRLMYYVGSIRGFWVGHMVPKLVKIAWNMTFFALFGHFHIKKIEMTLFSSSTIFWSILGEYEPFNVLRWWFEGLLSGSYSPKLRRKCMKYDILALFGHFHFKKVKNECSYWYY